MRPPTIDEFKEWAKAHKRAALMVCAAQALAQCERERVDAYILPIFERFTFVVGDIGRQDKGKPITNPDDLYLCEDEPLCLEFYAECDKAHREHGFTGPVGNCPALMVDYDRIKVENAFLKLGCDLFGLAGIPVLPEHRKKMLELLLGACLKDRKAA